MAAVSAAGYRAVFAPVAQAGKGKSIQPIVFVPLPAAPRFYFADRVVSGDFVSIASSPAWTARTAVTSRAEARGHTEAGQVLTASQTSNSATLRVRAAGDALLVASITRHKYWHASIDGKPAALIPVNVAYQAVSIPPGSHDVEMRYDNVLIRWSAVVSGLALIAAALLAFRR